MIIIGEKINGSIPSTAQAIAEDCVEYLTAYRKGFFGAPKKA
jgi:hypothetical protein